MSDYEQATQDLVGAIRLGYEVEQDDPHFHFDAPPEDEILWLGAWLASEGFSRPKDWASSSTRRG